MMSQVTSCLLLCMRSPIGQISDHMIRTSQRGPVRRRLAFHCVLRTQRHQMTVLRAPRERTQAGEQGGHL
ncbi:unnamed protein product [Staurois parvus]|uniref:Secreted protein n=1 Tax=Staurois parvus TaxID=386267 RepID=A0ABN9BRE9_9NEOB|nr:unnamed protein product [Staurois parvus]